MFLVVIDDDIVESYGWLLWTISESDNEKCDTSKGERGGYKYRHLATMLTLI